MHDTSRGVGGKNLDFMLNPGRCSEFVLHGHRIHGEISAYEEWISREITMRNHLVKPGDFVFGAIGVSVE
jgi:hypothetical protein